MYLKLWVGAEASYSFNINLQTDGAFSQSDTKNILLNGDGADVDFHASDWAPNTEKILAEDLIFMVGPIEVNINFRIPVFLQWTLQTAGGGQAYAGSYFKARLTQGIVYMNPDHTGECTMPGCMDSCSGWCTVDEKILGQGGSGPVWTFPDPVTLSVSLTPVFVVEVWSGIISGFFQVRSPAHARCLVVSSLFPL